MEEKSQRQESGEEHIDESGRNPTQRKLDEEVLPTGDGEKLVDVGWVDEGNDPDGEATPI